MTITDEMIRKARQAWLDLDDSSEKCWRAALEAIAPMLIAAGMREAIDMADDNDFDNWDEWQIAVLARAQELDPK